MQIMLTRVVMIEIHIRLSQDHCRRSFRFLTRARATCTAWFELCFTRAIIWLTPAFSEISFLQGKQQLQKGQHLFPGEHAEIIVMDSGKAHSGEIMVAQPVDTIPPAAPASVRDSMSPGSAPKENQRMDIMSDASLDLDL